VRFHVASLTPDVVFELTPRSVEGIANRHGNVLVFLSVTCLARRDDFAAWQSDVHTRRELIPVFAMFSARLDDDAATCYAAGKCLQLGRLLANIRFDLWRRIHLSKADLQGKLHGSGFLSSHREANTDLPGQHSYQRRECHDFSALRTLL